MGAMLPQNTKMERSQSDYARILSKGKREFLFVLGKLSHCDTSIKTEEVLLAREFLARGKQIRPPQKIEEGRFGRQHL